MVSNILNSHIGWFIIGLVMGGIGTLGLLWVAVSMGAETERERQIYERGGK